MTDVRTIQKTYMDCERCSRLCGARSGSPQLYTFTRVMIERGKQAYEISKSPDLRKDFGI